MSASAARILPRTGRRPSADAAASPLLTYPNTSASDLAIDTGNDFYGVGFEVVVNTATIASARQVMYKIGSSYFLRLQAPLVGGIRYRAGGTSKNLTIEGGGPLLAGVDYTFRVEHGVSLTVSRAGAGPWVLALSGGEDWTTSGQSTMQIGRENSGGSDPWNFGNIANPFSL